MQPAASASSGMGYERKKRNSNNMSHIPLSPIASSSASNYRSPAPYQGAHSTHPRSPSPPASAYFPLLSADTNARFRPIPDAESHFAYSTTLRRHHSEALKSPADFAAVVNAEASSLWARMVNAITGQQNKDYQRAETPGVSTDVSKDTASSKFAHSTVDVSLTQVTTISLLAEFA
jgi:P-type Ca2+ transporter type 2C